jgi:hypothetical protein
MLTAVFIMNILPPPGIMEAAESSDGMAVLK